MLEFERMKLQIRVLLISKRTILEQECNAKAAKIPYHSCLAAEKALWLLSKREKWKSVARDRGK
jgi:hypothetical protein